MASDSQVTGIPLTGPTLAPASGRAARQLVVLLHGVGSNGDDLIGLAPYLARALPDAAFVAPNAPYSCVYSPMGYQWYDIELREPAAKHAQLHDSAAIVDRFLDSELADRGLAPSHLALVGFSQGTMMSLYVAPRRAAPCAGVLGFSGRLDSPERLDAEIRCRPPVMLIHGDADDRLPVASMHQAAEALRRNGITVATHVCPGLGHSIDEAGMRLGAGFLAQLFAD